MNRRLFQNPRLLGVFFLGCSGVQLAELDASDKTTISVTALAVSEAPTEFKLGADAYWIQAVDADVDLRATPFEIDECEHKVW